MSARAIGLAVIACLAIGALACTPTRTKPAAGAGVVPPIVPGAPAPDLTFRWPEPASAIVTLRVDTGLGVKVLRATLELGAADADGRRKLERGAFEALEGGGLGAEAMAVSFGLTLSEATVMVERDGHVEGERGGDPLWVTWVPFWASFREDARGSTAEGANVSRDDHPSQAWPGARHLVYRSLGPKFAGVAAKLFGGLRELRIEGDIEPRTLQPLRIANTLTYAGREVPIVMVYEFDWSPTNERLRAPATSEDAAGDGQRPNGDTR